MANPIAWGAEAIEKLGTRIAGKGRMVYKTLGGEMNEEVAEQIGKETGEKLASIDAKQTNRRNATKTYRKAINEARVGTGEAAQEAIQANKPVGDTISFTGEDGVVYKRERNPNWKEGDSRKTPYNLKGENQFLYTADDVLINGKRFGEAKASHMKNGGTLNNTVNDVATAGDVATGSSDNSGGILDWASEHPFVIAGSIAGSALIGGALFGGPDDDY